VNGTDMLTVDGLSVDYRLVGVRGRRRRVVHDVSFSVPRGHTLGVVGESGSGKSTIGRAITGLVSPSAGRIVFDGEDVTRRGRSDRRRLGARIQMIFQDPFSSLNPMRTIGDSLTEPLAVHRRFTPADAARTVGALLDRVGLPTDAARRLPREFSGGQRQRIAIARALAVEPDLIVCDEPTSALDLSTQATVLNLLVELQRERGLSYVFISHDLAVVRHMAHDVAVVRAGRIVEYGDALQVTDHPRADYTRRLQLASLVPDPAEQRRRRERFEHGSGEDRIHAQKEIA